MVGHQFEVWICPRCLGCYASQSTEGEDLTQNFNKDIKNKPTFARSRCPNCSQGGEEVHRVRHIAEVIRKWEPPSTVMTEAEYWRSIEQRKGGDRESSSVEDFPVRGGPFPAES